MRKPANVLSLVVIAITAVAVWTLTQSRAGSERKFVSASAAGINILDLTLKAKDLPTQSFDAH